MIDSEKGVVDLTLIICTYEREELLNECLVSLERQTDQDYNLIIVDNGRTDRTADCANTFIKNHKSWRVIPCLEEGLSHARNEGMNQSETRWVGYLDDDAIVDDDFIVQVKSVIEKGEFDAFGGIYDPWYREGRKSWFSDRYGSNRHAYIPLKDRELFKHEFFSGGIAFYKRKMIKSAGGFNPELGMKAKIVSYGEETELQNILRGSGYKLGIAPHVLMRHLVANYKQSLKWQMVSQFQRGKATFAVLGERKKLDIVIKMIPKGVRAVCRVRKDDYDSIMGYFFGMGVEFLRTVTFSLGVLMGEELSKG